MRTEDYKQISQCLHFWLMQIQNSLDARMMSGPPAEEFDEAEFAFAKMSVRDRSKVFVNQPQSLRMNSFLFH